MFVLQLHYCVVITMALGKSYLFVLNNPLCLLSIMWLIVYFVGLSSKSCTSKSYLAFGFNLELSIVKSSTKVSREERKTKMLLNRVQRALTMYRAQCLKGMKSIHLGSTTTLWILRDDKHTWAPTWVSWRSMLCSYATPVFYIYHLHWF